VLSRRNFLKGSFAAAGLAAAGPRLGFKAAAPVAAPFDHVIVVMMENRSFDHFLGWLPGADGRQAGLSYTDRAGVTYPTYDLAPDYQGCGYADPDHSWEGGLVQLAGGANSGFLKTAKAGDTFPIGYYTEPSVPVLGALARSYTVSDNYFCSILAETYPNRFYQHSAMTPRDHNGDSEPIVQPTIWDRLAAAGVSHRYYFTDVPFIGLWGAKYLGIAGHVTEFLASCAAGTLPAVSFVDPAFAGEDQGVSKDDHPHADIRNGEVFLSLLYNAVRLSPLWPKTVMLVNFDEWGGFFDHVVPPRVIDDYVNPTAGRHPDYHQLGFRVPNVVVSPFSHKGMVVRGGAPFEHTSALRMIEWRWGLAPLRARDAHARNLADMLDFSLQRTDMPAIPLPAVPTTVACGVASTPARPPAPIRLASGAPPSPPGAPGAPGPSGPAGGGVLPPTGGDGALAAVGSAILAAGVAVGARQRRQRSPYSSRPTG
jgi:phospholipase C